MPQMRGSEQVVMTILCPARRMCRSGSTAGNGETGLPVVSCLVRSGPGVAFAAMIALAGPAAAASWPFEGVWDCEIGTFTFTDTTYDTGDDPMEIVDIAPEGDTFTLTFDDNYQLSLAMNPDGTMTWFSPVSGDSFLCRPGQ